MATLSSDKKSVTVVDGDTLTGIARTHSSLIAGSTITDKVNTMVKLNDIPNPDFIVIGQVIKLSGVSSTDKEKANTTNNTQAKITAFGIQSTQNNNGRTMYVTWKWPKNNTDQYQIKWHYGTGDGIWFIGSDTTTKDKQSTYTPPDNAIKVKFTVKPIAKKHKVDKKDRPYWTASWSTAKIHTFTQVLDTPSGLGVKTTGEGKDLKLVAEVNDYNGKATHIEFQVIINNSTKLSGVHKTAIKNKYALFSWNIVAGSEYKVCCRAVKDKLTSEWSSYVSADTPPAASKGITTLYRKSSTSIYISWHEVTNADSYNVEYTTDMDFFNTNPSAVSSVNIKNGVSATITNLGSGAIYYFRVQAVKGSETSEWTEIKAVSVGKKPSAPTTWSSTTTAIIGEPVFLYWTHNTEDGSKQQQAQLRLNIDDKTYEYTIASTPIGDEEEETTYSYTLTTDGYTAGHKVLWEIRTLGITNEWSNWSAQRVIDVYAKPTLEISVNDSKGVYIDYLKSFPFTISCKAGPSTQIPTGYHISITSNDTYETIDQVGNIKMVNKNEVVYSKYFDVYTHVYNANLSAENIDLENNISYTVHATVSMDSGLTAETTYRFTVAWEDVFHEPNAEIGINPEDLSATIRPYLSKKRMDYYKVVYDESTQKYIVTSEILDRLEGISVDGAYTSFGDIVYSGVADTGEEVYFCMIETEDEIIVEGVTLSVYRREFDGSFTEIMKDVDNSDSTYFHDPHPALDYARYRIVATTSSTGAVSYYDVPGIPVGEKAAIIQWNEQWSSFSTLNEDELEEEPISSSMLKLPYNIDVSDSYGVDVSLIKYVGRKRPVTYYGTQLGESSTWSMTIEKNDEETLYALRRLAIWTGDVYVREPSGSGYWANVSVSFSQKHCDLTIPVTLNIVRVEGGV